MITDDHSLAELYNSCDAVLFPSRLEDFSFVPLEAMACGKPVVASNTSSLPEAIIDRHTGLLCQPDNPESYAEACTYIANNPDVLREMGSADREHIKNNFSEKIILPKYLDLYTGNTASITTE